MKNLNNILNILIEKKKSVFITGPAGTGKTHLILQIYHELKQKNKNVILTSTTGLNAMNIGGITVHKLFGLQTRSDLNYIKYMKSTFLFRGICLRMKKIEYVIIDEVSMLRSDTFELIDEILKKATNSNIPFGGKILIMSGDFFQTPPVSKKWEKSQWLFDSQSWKELNVETFQMNTIFRQSDKTFINFLNNIRIGKWNKNTNKIIKICEKNILDKNTTVFFSTNEECQKFNIQKINKLPGKLYTFNAEITGKRNKKYRNDKITIAKNCIALEQLHLKINTKVVALINDKKNRFVNGSIGYVTNCDQKNLTVTVKFDNFETPIKLRRNTWHKFDFNGKIKAKFKQIPLLPGYALTIHKSQGMTLESAIVDCKKIFTYGQLYVALSRVKSYQKLKIINFNRKQIITSEEVKHFYGIN